MDTLLSCASSKLNHEIRSLRLSSALLILDEAVLPIVSPLLPSSQLAELNLIGVEKLQLNRKPFPSLPAVYLLSPSANSIRLLARDFSSRPTYAQAHVLFTDSLSKDQFALLSQEEALLPHLANLRELLIDFQAVQKSLFLLPCAQLKKAQQQDYSLEKSKVASQLGRQLATVVVSLGQFYEVEIFYTEKPSTGSMAQDVAYNCENRLRNICKSLQDSQSPFLDQSAPKTNVLVVQRGDDLSSALARDFHYLPLLQDELHVPGQGVVHQKKVVDLEDDEVLANYQHRHFGDVQESLQKDVKTFIANSATVKVQKGDSTGNNLDKAMKELPTYTQKVKQYEMHIAIVQSLMATIHQKKLLEAGELEQTLSCQVDSKGKPSEATPVLKALLSLLGSNIHLEPLDRFRLIALAFVNLELSSSDRQKLLNRLQLSEQDTLRTLLKAQGHDLDTPYDKTAFRKRPVVQAISQQKFQKSDKILDRHSGVVEAIVARGMGQGTFQPQGVDGLGVESLHMNQPQGKQQVGSLRNKGLVDRLMGDPSKAPRLVVFFLGGVSHHEIRTLSQVASKGGMALSLGGTEVLTARSLLQS